MKKFLLTIALALAMILALASPGTAAAAIKDPEAASPCFTNTSGVGLNITFYEGTRKMDCSVKVCGKSGTSRIIGTLILKDVNTNQAWRIWTFNTTEILYAKTYEAPYTSGHKYKLQLTAQVYNAAGKPESVNLTYNSTTAP